ncbi:BPSL0067 family protein [Vibrio vulnificus]|nr:BPSL0067 family protein [Vibrio vulnificus]
MVFFKSLSTILLILFPLLSYAYGTPTTVNDGFRLGNLSLTRVSADEFVVKDTQENIDFLNSVISGFSAYSDNGFVTIGNGQCVSLTKALSNVASPTSNWIKGVNANNRFNVPLYTPVATFFDNGGHPSVNYGNNNFSHTGIIVMFDRDGFYMLQQNSSGYAGNPVGKMVVKFMSGSGDHQSNANNYFVINR